jgi:hypothetical protein
MRSLFLLPAFCVFPGLSQAQTPDSLINELKAARGSLISNRAMNVFLSEAVGYYLSSPDDLTLYKNSVVANAAEGSLAIYHNLRQAPGTDERIGSFLSIGASANVADAFTAASEGRHYNNRFGLLVKQTWIGNGKTTYTEGQQKIMKALRAGILHSLELEIRKKAADLEASLDAWNADDVPGQDLAAAKQIARQKFNADLQAEYEFEFARRQSEALARTFNYAVIAVNWTSLSLYVPLVTENFSTAPDLTSGPVTRHAYPLHFNITHTRLWEGSQFGRLYATLAGDLTLSNSRDGYGLDKTGDLYTGDYKNFLTPALTAQAVYFPRDSHIGISLHLEQNFGSYRALNGRLGIPVVLINKKAEPSVNFEFQVRFFDLSDQVGSRKGLPGKTSVGLTMGIPFSKIAF